MSRLEVREVGGLGKRFVNKTIQLIFFYPLIDESHFLKRLVNHHSRKNQLFYLRNDKLLAIRLKPEDLNLTSKYKK